MPITSLSLVTLDQFDVTSGPISEIEPGFLSVEDPEIRATIPLEETHLACIQFIYSGPVEHPVPAGSGEYLHQIGMMLRAANQCNLIYLTWRILPRPEILLQVKLNPGATSHDECPGGSGYHPIAHRDYRAFEPGEMHELLAAVTANKDGSAEVRTWINWEEVMRATIPATLLTGIVGPPGFRSDNGKYRCHYFVGQY